MADIVQLLEEYFEKDDSQLIPPIRPIVFTVDPPILVRCGGSGVHLDRLLAQAVSSC